MSITERTHCEVAGHIYSFALILSLILPWSLITCRSNTLEFVSLSSVTNSLSDTSTCSYVGLFDSCGEYKVSKSSKTAFAFCFYLLTLAKTVHNVAHM